MNDPRNTTPGMGPLDPDNEPTDANPVPLSPTDPKRRTGTGEQTPADMDRGPRLAAVPSGGALAGGGTAMGGIVAPVGPIDTPERTDPSVRPDSEGAV